MRFRPENDPRIQKARELEASVEAEADDNPGSPVEWEDNSLSNFFAWSSYRLTPNWCQTPEHFTSRLTQYLWTDCPCCLLFRGITVGIGLTSVVFVVVCSLVYLYR
jgi:hypothetical protein